MGGTFRVEFVQARDLTNNLGAGLPRATAPAQAWQALYTHNLGEQYVIALRYDEFDPDTRNRVRLGGDGEVRTIGLVGIRQIGENIRFTLALERPRLTLFDKATQTSKHRNDDTVTFQGQFRF